MQKPSKDLQKHKFHFLSPVDFEFICFNLAKQFMEFSEPIPDYSTRDIALLESAISNPYQVFNGQLLYPTLSKQAAVLFYSIIKNHPFRNGNKRIAVIGLLTHLALNIKWIDLPPRRLYDVARVVASSLPEERDDVLIELEAIIEEYMVDLPFKK